MTDTQVLKKVCLRVQPGHTVALVGASGCGKSTCVQLLQRLYDADNGEITLDGISIKDLNIRWLRTQLGVVGQEPVLFNMTIAKNITFGLKDVSEEEVKAAAKLAYAHKFIMQLPQVFRTQSKQLYFFDRSPLSLHFPLILSKGLRYFGRRTRC